VIELLEDVVGPPVALEPLKNKPGRPRGLCAIGPRRTAIVKDHESERTPVVACKIAALSAGPPEPAVPVVLGLDAARRLVVLSDVPGTPFRDAIVAVDAAEGLSPHTAKREVDVLRSCAREAAPEVPAA
jgi:hypothetical protein